MTCSIKPLSCDPARVQGMSERLIISHSYHIGYGAKPADYVGMTAINWPAMQRVYDGASS